MSVRLAGLLLLIVVGGLALAASACSQSPSEVVVQLLPQSGSDQSGTATLKPMGDKTEVIVKVGSALPQPQPTHIHYGTCGPRLGQVHYGLANVVEGESTTVVEAALEDLRDGNNAINVHKSLPEISGYTACGNIPAK